MGRIRPIAIATLLALLGASGLVAAAKVYRWTDSNGVTHYGDRPPAGATSAKPGAAAPKVQRVRIPPESQPISAMRVENEGSRHLVWADNKLAGPIEVRLRFERSRNITSEPALPARATVPASGSALVAVLTIAEAGGGGEFRLQMDSLPGTPSARPKDVEYQAPLRQRSVRIDQGYGGEFSHTDPQNLHAVDFAASVGTPVLAARDGVVMQVASDYDKSGLSRERYAGRANFIRIAHDDGTMALYAHLKSDGVLVRVGQRVRAGQQIGLSGNTGYTTGPHLHFVVQVNRGMRLESMPFRMRGPAGPLKITRPR
ncbi:MAG: Membrane proteins related to metalloendopeptidases [uncultured Lysobacter sp.]|uniref:Membrane proteins related to metalloendopeptidases n=1 Tax=uncultured Lysobacter sp. TaxID=271060 RepID=A0A6J4LH79_9GAMM|nr:MAG: Membrane proteins related to metalloendopeptidases [uncultured Lysobacter sp.]